MFQNAQFFLTSNAYTRLAPTGSAKVSKQCQIIPLTPDEANIKSCRNLEDRLSEKLDKSDWGLDIELINWKVLAQEVDMNEIVVSGKLLNQLHSLLLYNDGKGRLKMKVSASVQVTAQVTNLVAKVFHETETVATTVVKFESEMFPSTTEEGSCDHSRYTNNSVVFSHPIMAQKLSLTQNKVQSPDFQFHVNNLSVSIEGTVYDLNMCYAKHSNPILDSQRRLLDTGMRSDLKMLVQGNEEVPCHEFVLFAQSSVLQTMLQDKSFVEGATRRILMDGRTKDEVMAFLNFLYCGDLSKSLGNPTLGVTLYEMGHYYDVKGLESAIKTLLFSTPAELFEVDAALRLLNIAYGTNDLELKRKAADVLETKTNEDIFGSSLFNELSAPVVRELFGMSRRK